ncbi:DUF4238 domain-containing protein [Lysinibacillus sphaericus]|uniref:DUF4238 domain-containing protein n=1 Tax=Lysinibacillus sphaericus TaxID=1421 RepID=UPI0038214417
MNLNLNTEAVFHHLTPQTYMRGWKHGSSSVYFIEKNDGNINDDWNRNTRRLAGENHFYSRRAGSIYKTEQDCLTFFKPLNGYDIIHTGIHLTSALDLNNYFIDYEYWDIYKNGVKISSQEKQDLKEAILNIHVRDIEAGWDRQYENNWNSITEGILDNLKKYPNQDVIPAVKRDELIKFMVSIEWRTKPYHPVLIDSFNKLLDVTGLNTSNLKSMIIPENVRLYPFIETEYDELLHGVLLSKYHQFLNNTGIMMDEANKYIDNLLVNLLIAPKDAEFITSDNPVCRFKNEQGSIEYVFPINNKLACALRKTEGDVKNNYNISKLSKNEVFYYNDHLKNNCYKGYILKEKDLSLYFK